MSDRKLRFLLCFGPPLLYLTVFMIVPYGYMFYFSFLKKAGYSIEHTLNVDNYIRVFTNPLYLKVILSSARIALIVTVLAVIIGYALAFFIAYIAKPSRKRLFYFLIIIPLWSSFLLRVFIWKLILGREGLINVTLMSSGIIDEPLTFILYNDFSVILTLTYVFIPFVALPVYAALEKIPPSYIEASMDLGGGPFRTFRKVVLPLSLPGLLAGATFTFCLSFGDFVTPTLLGGASGIMIADVIISQFLVAFEWPFGSALAVTLLIAVLIPVTISSRFEKRSGGQIA